MLKRILAAFIAFAMIMWSLSVLAETPEMLPEELAANEIGASVAGGTGEEPLAWQTDGQVDLTETQDDATLFVVSGDYEYSVNGDGTVTITGYTGKGGDVAIPGTIDGKKLQALARVLFTGAETLQA